jgi:hypothetical protein
MEVFQNGVFTKTGEPVYQIGTKQKDGSYVTVVFDLMSKEQAEAKLESMDVKKPAPKKPAAKKAPVKKKTASKK